VNVISTGICEYEAERHEWRAEVLEFIRDHVQPHTVYRLGERDLEFGELVPEKPWAVEQEEFEDRNRVGFQLERLAKSVDRMPPAAYAIAGGPTDHDE
jgi:hypothetical protein